MFTIIIAFFAFFATVSQIVEACDILRTGINEQHKEEILGVHNYYRSLIATGNVRGQPMAQDMMVLEWDDELARMAQTWAERCVKGHDNNRHVHRFRVGQNVAVTWTNKYPSSYQLTNPDFSDQIRKWFNEYQIYYYQSIPFKSQAKTGHYTQLAWSKTTKVGCGFAFYYTPVRGFTKHYVCNYGPSGNIMGSKPYEAGVPACTRLNMEYSRQYPGLCEKPTTYTPYYQTPEYINYVK